MNDCVIQVVSKPELHVTNWALFDQPSHKVKNEQQHSTVLYSGAASGENSLAVPQKVKQSCHMISNGTPRCIYPKDLETETQT